MTKHFRTVFLLLFLVFTYQELFALDTPVGNKALSIGVTIPAGKAAFIYNLQYLNALMYDANGDKIIANGKSRKSDVIAQTIVFNWVTNVKILGGMLNMTVAQPFLSTNIRNATPDGGTISTNALVDTSITPFALAWTSPHVDSIFSLGLIVPSGGAGVTKSQFTGFISGAFTFYFDKERAWQFSISPLFEVHSPKFNSGTTRGSITEGVDFLVNYAIGYRFLNFNTIGVVGYSTAQISDDLGSGRQIMIGDEYTHAIGIEYDRVIPQLDAVFKILVHQELASASRALGTRLHLSFAKTF